MVRPKKHLGQHFLADKNIAQKITRLLPNNNLQLLEIGPGTGVLTQFLEPRFGNKLHVIEIDQESIEFLKNRFPSIIQNIHFADFLQTDLSSIFQGQFMVVGNFPYNISSPILFKILENRASIPLVVGMFQKEVAERIAASHNSKQYGILSAWTQLFYKVSYCFTVPEHVFVPPPKVKSGVISLSRIDRDLKGVDSSFLLSIIKTSFNQRRKTLRNSLKGFISNSTVDPKLLAKRPEQLSPEDFINLARELS